jgi:hypothetical protein
MPTARHEHSTPGGDYSTGKESHFRIDFAADVKGETMNG